MLPTGLYPREGVRPTTSLAEQTVYRALQKALPEGWTAWHSLRVRLNRGPEGEGDFVLAIPDRGVLVLEVKGGQIEVIDGQWLQNGHRMARSPREQSHEFTKKLVSLLEARYAGAIPWFVAATVFPDTAFDAGPTNGDVAGAVLGEQDLAYLRDALLALVDRLLRPGGAPRDLDVDRHRHVLPQVGRRVGHAELHPDGAAQRVDAGIDVEEFRGEALVRVRVG